MNRLRCVWCRHGVPDAKVNVRFYGHWTLCPEHKRLRNRRLRARAAVVREGTSPE